MPYIIIRGNLASYSHKYPWRVLVSGLKGEDIEQLNKFSCGGYSDESTIVYLVHPCRILSALEILGFRVVASSSTAVKQDYNEYMWTMRKEFHEPEPLEAESVRRNTAEKIWSKLTGRPMESTNTNPQEPMNPMNPASNLSCACPPTSSAAAQTTSSNTCTTTNVVTIPVPIVQNEDNYTYITVKGSLHDRTCTVFGLNDAEIQALSKRFESGVKQAVNGVMIGVPPIVMVNTMAQLSYKVVCSCGEAEICWTMQREI